MQNTLSKCPNHRTKKIENSGLTRLGKNNFGVEEHAPNQNNKYPYMRNINLETQQEK